MRLVELNKIQDYYKNNPSNLKKTDFKSGGVDKRGVLNPTNIELNEKYKSFIDYFNNKWSGLIVGINKPIDIINKNTNIISTAELFIKDNHIISNEVKRYIIDNWEKLKKDIIQYITIRNVKNSYQDKKLSKDSLHKGYETDSYKELIKEIIKYTSMAKNKVDPNAWSHLRKLTVDEKNLPTYVYRGLFYDGAKIKDRDKFLKKWYVGSFPKVRFTKISSWSADKSIAKGFMNPQDFVKDEKNGFYILLKYKITDPSIVIADFRNLPNLNFWSQKEILLSPDAVDYQVEEIFDNKDDFKKYRGNDYTFGGQGYNEIDYIIRNYFNNTNINYKNLKDLTLRDVLNTIKSDNKILNDSINPIYLDINFSLFCFIFRINGDNLPKYSVPEVESSSNITILLDFEHDLAKQYDINYNDITIKTTIILKNNEYNNFVFNLSCDDINYQRISNDIKIKRITDNKDNILKEVKQVITNRYSSKRIKIT